MKLPVNEYINVEHKFAMLSVTGTNRNHVRAQNLIE